MSLFRERLLARLVDSHAISPELVAKLLAWKHPGFSAHVGEELAPEQRQRLEDTAAYLVRNPLSLKKLVYLDGEKAVVYRSRMNPSLGRNFEAMDPLEWLARLSDHIPDPGQHRTLFYGEYSNRVRGAVEPAGGGDAGGGRAPAAPAHLAELGTADRQGLPGGPAGVHSLRPAHEPHRLRHRPGGDREDPRPPRPQRARRRKSRHRRCARSSASPSTVTAGACRRSGSRPELPQPVGHSVRSHPPRRRRLPEARRRKDRALGGKEVGGRSESVHAVPGVATPDYLVWPLWWPWNRSLPSAAPDHR